MKILGGVQEFINCLMQNTEHVNLSSGKAHLNFHLSCCQIMLGIQGNISLYCIFLLAPGTLDENIMLVLIEILLVPGSIFTPGVTNRT